MNRSLIKKKYHFAGSFLKEPIEKSTSKKKLWIVGVLDTEIQLWGKILETFWLVVAYNKKNWTRGRNHNQLKGLWKKQIFKKCLLKCCLQKFLFDVVK